ncbi:MAG TPA: hypothetical protein VIM12_14455 [Noviherbaspirillum sp.]|jgi:hypothetical protein|uniref:hypothetical protein n=1 Tax=Noviherbaspirillum sp. TaxID=1926288 RepID=UPI002F93AAA5
MSTKQDLQTMGQYMLNYLAAVDVLTKEQNYLEGISGSLLGTQAERAEAAGAAAVIGAKLLELESIHNTTVLAFQGGIKPPSKEMVEKSRELTEQLAHTIRQQVRATVILGAVTQFVAAWAALG